MRKDIEDRVDHLDNELRQLDTFGVVDAGGSAYSTAYRIASEALRYIIELNREVVYDARVNDGFYVAYYNNYVLDYDASEIDLLRRVTEKFGIKTVEHLRTR